MKQLFCQYLINEFASLASIIGLVLTIFVFFNVRNIRSYYKKRIRLPQLLSKIGQNTQTISDLLNNFQGNIDSIQIEICKTESNLKTLYKNTNQSIKSECNKILKDIKKLPKASSQETAIRQIHRSLHKVIESAKNLQEDLNWEN